MIRKTCRLPPVSVAVFFLASAVTACGSGAGSGQPAASTSQATISSVAGSGAAGSPPAPAAAVGYTDNTFDSTTLGRSVGTVQAWNFFFNKVPDGGIIQNDDGSLTLTGQSGNSYAITVSTAAQNYRNPQLWQGIAFGGGAYFEVSASYTGTQTSDLMAILAFDILTTSGYTSQATQGYMGIEIDGPEFDVPGSTSQYGISCHNYYYNDGAKSRANPFVLANGGSLVTTSRGDLHNLNTYGTLWVPATSSARGYLEFFFNGQQVGPTVFWNQYSANQGFPPTGSDVCNFLDTLRMIPMIGTSNTSTPMTIASFRVWQGPGANNAEY